METKFELLTSGVARAFRLAFAAFPASRTLLIVFGTLLCYMHSLFSICYVIHVCIQIYSIFLKYTYFCPYFSHLLFFLVSLSFPLPSSFPRTLIPPASYSLSLSLSHSYSLCPIFFLLPFSSPSTTLPFSSSSRNSGLPVASRVKTLGEGVVCFKKKSGREGM